MPKIKATYRVRGCDGFCTDTFDVKDYTDESVFDAIDSFVKELLGEQFTVGQVICFVPANIEGGGYAIPLASDQSQHPTLH